MSPDVEDLKNMHIEKPANVEYLRARIEALEAEREMLARAIVNDQTSTKAIYAENQARIEALEAALQGCADKLADAAAPYVLPYVPGRASEKEWDVARRKIVKSARALLALGAWQAVVEG